MDFQVYQVQRTVNELDEDLDWCVDTIAFRILSVTPESLMADFEEWHWSLKKAREHINNNLAVDYSNSLCQNLMEKLKTAGVTKL